MSECCGQYKCISGLTSGAGIVSDAPPYISENQPFETGNGGCCGIVCSGFPDVTQGQQYDIEYVSIDDGQGGFIENISGCNTGSLPCFAYACCTPSPVYNPTLGFSYATGCPVNSWGTVCTATVPHPSTYVQCGTSTTSCSTMTSPAACACFCCYTGFNGDCLPFQYDTETCRFTGKLYNNDEGCSKFEGNASIYFDACANSWAITTEWSGSQLQWEAGQTLHSDCNGCTGLSHCKEKEPAEYWDVWYGSYSNTGSAVGTVCVIRDECGADNYKSKAYGCPDMEACS